jgi:hypothetical protein
MSILFPIYHCLGCLKALLLTFNFEHHELTSTFLFRAFVRLRLRTLKQMPRITLSLFVFFHFSHSLPETTVCASDYPFYFRGSSASGASEISLDPGEPDTFDLADQPLKNRSKGESPATSVVLSHPHHLTPYRLAPLHRPSSFIPNHSSVLCN